jgi:uncharacterized protein YuzE
MASLATHGTQRYPRPMRAHYDPEVDIALIVLEPGKAVSEEHAWGLIDRDPEDNHLMGFEIWEASSNLPPELIAALPSPADTRDAA